MKISIIVLAAAFMLSVAAVPGIGAEGTFGAKLTGKASVPPVETKATGKASFTLTKKGQELYYTLSVKGIEKLTAAHIHAGKKDANGEPVAGLFAGPKKEGKFSGTVAKGTITDKNLVGRLAGKTIDDLVALIKSGDAYVNVHTENNPAGEIRGQISKNTVYTDRHQAD